MPHSSVFQTQGLQKKKKENKAEAEEGGPDIHTYKHNSSSPNAGPETPKDVRKE